MLQAEYKNTHKTPQNIQETQLSLTNRATHLCKRNDKICPYVRYHAEFGRSALKDADINTGNPKNWGALELRSLGMGGVADPKIHPIPDMYSYHVKFGSFVTKGVRINRKEFPKYGERWDSVPLGWGASDHLKTSPAVYVLPCEIL